MLLRLHEHRAKSSQVETEGIINEKSAEGQGMLLIEVNGESEDPLVLVMRLAASRSVSRTSQSERAIYRGICVGGVYPFQSCPIQLRWP